jgi:hypothetical protein
MSAIDKANQGLIALKEAILEHLAQHPEGIGNSDIARDLGLESDFGGRQRNYLTWSVLGLLSHEKRVVVEKRGRNVFYKLP